MDRSNRQVVRIRRRDHRMSRETRTDNESTSSLTDDNTAFHHANRRNPGRRRLHVRETWLRRFNMSFSSRLLLGVLIMLCFTVTRVEGLEAMMREFMQQAVTDAQSGDFTRLVAFIVAVTVLIIFLCLRLFERPIRTDETGYSDGDWRSLYRTLRPTRSLDLRQYVNDVQSICDIATSFGTGYIYVSGNRGGAEGYVFIVQLDRFIRITNVFTTDVPSSFHSFISVSPTGELIITSSSSTEINCLNDRGRLLKSVETGSRCGRCVSDGQSLYVCHPDLKCVSVLDHQGQRLLRIGTEELEFPWFLAMDRTRMLYVSDERTKRLHVFSSDGELVRQIGGTAGRENVFWPQGVCVDPTGNVLLSDRCEKCVHMYDRHGQRFLKLQDPKITKPMGLTVTPTGDAVILVNQTNQVVNPVTLITFSS